MKIIALLLVVSVSVALSAPQAHADTLLIQRVQAEQGAHLPKRGSSMTQVQTQFGAPQQKFAAVGGGSVHTPPITRWQYDQFSVYFENSHVVDAVMTKSSPEEIGPAPVKH